MSDVKTNLETEAKTPGDIERSSPSAGSACSGGITKEMWTVLLDTGGSWLPTDVFCDTSEQVEAQLATLRELHAEYQPESTQLDGAVVTRCIVSIYLPNAKLTGGSDNAAKNAKGKP